MDLLPLELIEKIINKLEFHEMSNLFQSCKSFNKLVDYVKYDLPVNMKILNNCFLVIILQIWNTVLMILIIQGKNQMMI